jgi:hypothetical protein
MRNLVLARVGANSLHRSWLEPERPRTWELHLAPFQPLGETAGEGCVVHDVVVGPKWSGLRELLNGWDGWREYDYVWLPDDDLLARAGAIDDMFAVAAATGLDLFAPALDEASHFAHFITMRNPRFFARRVGFVEIMMPGLSRQALERLLFTLDLTETGWGWGLDSVWPKLLDYRNVGIIDRITVTHTRPVGEMRDPELQRRVLAESDRLLESFDCRQTHATFGAVGPDSEPVELSPDELLTELVRGWDYLIAEDPRLLRWIVDFQQPHFQWPEYPVAGTPRKRTQGSRRERGLARQAGRRA